MDEDDFPLWLQRLKRRVDRVQPRSVRRIGVAVIGATVLLLGVVMVVLPGPAILVIPMGLAILALEFSWARHWFKKANALFRRGKSNPGGTAKNAGAASRGAMGFAAGPSWSGRSGPLTAASAGAREAER